VQIVATDVIASPHRRRSAPGPRPRGGRTAATPSAVDRQARDRGPARAGPGPIGFRAWEDPAAPCAIAPSRIPARRRGPCVRARPR